MTSVARPAAAPAYNISRLPGGTDAAARPAGVTMHLERRRRRRRHHHRIVATLRLSVLARLLLQR